MRRLKNEEHGAIAVMTALLMVLVLGITALVIDVGLVYAERAQLQSGADAAALAIAQDCALKEKCDEKSRTHTATILAGANANDGQSRAVATKKESENTVTVQTRTLTADGENGVQHWFAPILGIDSTEVGAVAKASWGSPIAGPAPFPMAFSKCDVQRTGDPEVVRFQKKGPKAPACPGSPPGGFGKLDQSPGKCGAIVNDDRSVGSDNGNSVPSNCDELLASWKSAIESGAYPIGLFPIYDSEAGSGSKATYGISGFAAFEVFGWKWKQGGSNKTLEEFRSDYYPGMKCGNDICLIGKFVNQVILHDEYTMGPPNDSGVTIVKLTG